MKNLNFIDASELVLEQSQTSSETKNRTLEPNFELVKSAFADKQESKYKLQDVSLNNLYLVGKIEINIATDVQAIVLAMETVKKADGTIVNSIRKAYKIIPEIVKLNNVDTVKHIFKKFTMSPNQRPIIEKSQKAKLTVDMLTA